MKKSEIITAIIAVYGAVLSTIAILRQYLSDRVKVRFTVGKNREIVGDPRYRGMTLTVLTVTNVGRRPVTITTFGAIGLYPHKSMVAAETQPTLPREITEGQYITSNWPQDDIDFSTIDYWSARDSHGREYVLPEASRLKHWKSVRQQKREWRKKKAESSQNHSLGTGA
jgi:hypothetical protein